jgi:F-type H+-transporting ATPase subunit epsilon
MVLHIYTPEQTVYSGEAESIMVPGKNQWPFVILDSHAPVVAVLETGVVKYVVRQNEFELHITSGFVEVRENVVTICVEI